MALLPKKVLIDHLNWP